MLTIMLIPMFFSLGGFMEEEYSLVIILPKIPLVFFIHRKNKQFFSPILYFRKETEALEATNNSSVLPKMSVKKLDAEFEELVEAEGAQISKGNLLGSRDYEGC